MTYRVVQWTTGNVGKKSVHAIAENSSLELVGCYAWSPDKVGRDVGELCGIKPMGVPDEAYKKAQIDLCKKQAVLAGTRLANYLNATLKAHPTG